MSLTEFRREEKRRPSAIGRYVIGDETATAAVRWVGDTTEEAAIDYARSELRRIPDEEFYVLI